MKDVEFLIWTFWTNLKRKKLKSNKLSPFLFKMMMNFYPPFLFGRVRVKYVSDDFKQVKVRVWLKSAVGDRYLDFKISQEDLERVKLGLETKGKHNETHVVHLIDKQGDVCATVELVTYIGLP